MLRVTVFRLCLMAAVSMSPSVMAQQKQEGQRTPSEKQSPEASPPNASPRPATVAPKAPSVPPAQTMMMMIRGTLIALNHANQTGNYTVLRDLGSPAFQRANSAARLGAIFTNLRDQGINMSPVILVTPALDVPAAITPDGMLKLVGHFPTKPLRINFQMLFQVVDGRWRLFGLAVNTVTAATAVPPQAKPAKTKKKSK